LSELRAAPFFHRVYDVVNVVLWLLVPVILAMFIFAMPRMADAKKQVAQQRADDMASENHAYCQKWGMAAGTAQHESCLRDLVDLRARDEKYVLEQLDGLL
jgi:hypothetical protein